MLSLNMKRYEGVTEDGTVDKIIHVVDMKSHSFNGKYSSFKRNWSPPPAETSLGLQTLTSHEMRLDIYLSLN